MSDVEPDLPDYLIEAILSEGPSPADLDVVKNAFTWRSIDAELMELTYDSAADLVGVRDAGDYRTLEFTMPAITLLIEVSLGQVQGRMTPALADTSIELRRADAGNDDASQRIPVTADGSFAFNDVPAGSVHLRLITPTATITTQSFAVGS